MVLMTDLIRWEDSDHWVEIDLEICAGLGLCVEICPVEVYTLIKGKVNAKDIGSCIECKTCMDMCPNDAIKIHSAW